LKITYAAGLMHQYTYEGGTLDSIPSNQVLFFRISGEIKMNEATE